MKTKITFISDTHGRHDQVRIKPCDILIHCGDVTRDTGRKSLTDFCIWLNRQPAKLKIFIAGNHDGAFEAHRIDAEDIVQTYAPGSIYLQESGIENIGGRQIPWVWGSPYTPTFGDWHFMRQRGEDIKRHWDLIPGGIDILVTHGPPHGIMDWSVYDKIHVGCEELAKAVEMVKPKIHAFGHIHSCHGVMEKDGVTYINASVINEQYKVAYEPITIEM